METSDPWISWLCLFAMAAREIVLFTRRLSVFVALFNEFIVNVDSRNAMYRQLNPYRMYRSINLSKILAFYCSI